MSTEIKVEKKELEEGTQEREWLYYFGLYQTLAHWAAFITILVLLITMGMLLSTSQTGIIHMKSAAAAVIALWGGEIYLLRRIIVLSNLVLEFVPSIRRWEFIIPHPYNHIITFLAATLFALWDILLILGKV
jgi:hypothetical protein